MTRMVRLGLIASAMAAAVALGGCFFPIFKTSATLTVDPETAETGAQVEFTGRSEASSPHYAFDLDGDGTFERDTGSTRLVRRAYEEPQSLTVALKVATDCGLCFMDSPGVDTKPLTITGAGKPAAAFTVSPNPGGIGQPIKFDGSASRVAGGTIVRYEWDLDGDGRFETDSGSNPVVTKTYSTTGLVKTGLRVTDNLGRKATTKKSVLVDAANQAPVASFTVAPTVVMGERRFDGSASSDKEGPIKRYQWDLDGNGSFETDSGTNPVVFKKYNAGATLNISLRVTDAAGATGTLTKQVDIFLKAPLDTSAASTGKGAGSRVRLRPVSGRTVGTARQNTRRTLLAGDTLVTRGRRSVGHAILHGFPDRLALPEKVSWATRISSTQDIETDEVQASGSMLLVFSHRRTSCLSIAFMSPADARPTGTFQVVGGTGRAARLSGGGEFHVPGPTAGTPVPVGTGQLSVGEKRAIPRGSCQGLAGLVHGRLSHRRHH